MLKVGRSYADHLSSAWVEVSEQSRKEPAECINRIAGLIKESDSLYNQLVSHVGELTFYTTIWEACLLVDECTAAICEIFKAAVAHSKSDEITHQSKVIVAEKQIELGAPDDAAMTIATVNPNLLSEAGQLSYYMTMRVLISSYVSSALLDEAFTLYQSEHYNVLDAPEIDRIPVLKSIAYAHLKNKDYTSLEEALSTLAAAKLSEKVSLTFSEALRGLAAYAQGKKVRALFYFNSFSIAELKEEKTGSFLFEEVVEAYQQLYKEQKLVFEDEGSDVT